MSGWQEEEVRVSEVRVRSELEEETRPSVTGPPSPRGVPQRPRWLQVEHSLFTCVPQSKPLIPLQKEEDPETHKTVLTNYMFPQQTRTEDCEYQPPVCRARLTRTRNATRGCKDSPG